MTAVAPVAPDRGHQRAAFAAGVRAALPYVATFAPYGLAIGAFADQARVPDLLGWSTAWLTYAGTSQLVLLQMLDAGATPLAVLATVALVNVRLVAYSTAMTPYWRTAPRWWTALASYLLVDPAYVIASRQQPPRGIAGPAGAAAGVAWWHRCHYLGAATTLWGSWLLVCGAGVAFGERLAGIVPSGVLVDLMLVSMLGVLARDGRGRVAAGAGFMFGVPAVLLPAGTGATVAAAAAVATAMLVDRAAARARGRVRS